ncbi:MAG TPA: hypothetical protein PKZ53_26425, partial [Acidobacteriota bacterium]|nr:hypothetical protein [Acidobacteriota bacterium]
HPSSFIPHPFDCPKPDVFHPKPDVFHPKPDVFRPLLFSPMVSRFSGFPKFPHCRTPVFCVFLRFSFAPILSLFFFLYVKPKTNHCRELENV